MYSPSPTEILANLSISCVTIVIIISTIVRIALIKVKSIKSHALAEFVESAIIAFALVYLLIRPFVLQAYFIPSPSMVPTLLGKNGVGDRILVNKFIYRVSYPKRDDIVVFIPPKNASEDMPNQPENMPINFIKRLIGRSGDVIEAKAGYVLINGQKYSHSKLRDALLSSTALVAQSSMDSDTLADHHLKFVPNKVLLDGNSVDLSKVSQVLTSQPNYKVTVVPGETIRNGEVLKEPFIAEDPDYDMKLYHGQPLKKDAKECRLNGVPIPESQYNELVKSPAEHIPPHRLFMMGDNRNDSKDSTEWGPLNDKMIVGKAQFIFWPLKRVGIIKQ